MFLYIGFYFYHPENTLHDEILRSDHSSMFKCDRNFVYIKFENLSSQIIIFVSF